MYKRTGKKPTLFIVEGHQEADLLKSLKDDGKCGEGRERTLNTNGKKFSMQAMAKRIDAIIEDTDEECSPVVVLFDREKRNESVDEIILAVKQELKKLGHDMENFIIGVADRHTESWMLPIVDIKGNFPVQPYKGCDGRFGEPELKRRLKKRGIPYKKRKVGIEILKEVNAIELAQVSESFNKFYRQVKDHCKWLH